MFIMQRVVECLLLAEDIDYLRQLYQVLYPFSPEVCVSTVMSIHNNVEEHVFTIPPYTFSSSIR